MDKFAKLTGRRYHLFDYVGAPDAERVIVMMGSGAETAAGNRRIPRSPRAKRSACSRSACTAPSPLDAFIKALPATVKSIAVLDRTKEPGSPASRSTWMCVTALGRRHGRRQLPPSATCRASSAAATACPPRNSPRPWSRPSSTSCTKPTPKNHFTVGINDDVTHTSLAYDPSLLAPNHRAPCGPCSSASAPTAPSAPTRTRSRSSAKRPTTYAQGYFVYDSKKSGSITISHLRFGPKPIRSPYLIAQANFIACHQFTFLEQLDMLSYAEPGRRLPAQQPLSARTRSGTTCRARSSSRSSPRS